MYFYVVEEDAYTHIERKPFIEMPDLVSFPTSLSATDVVQCESGAKEMLKKLKPQWNLDDVTFEVFTVGITNKIFSAACSGEKLIFRVFGQNTEKVIDRSHELTSWSRLASRGLAAILYAKFDNGLVCGYIEGDSLTRELVRLPDIKKEICRSISKMHTIPAEGVVSACTFPKMKAFVAAFNPQYKDSDKQAKFNEYFTECLTKQIKELQELISDMNEPVVFCHNDLLVHNILFNKEESSVSFIDYEYADYNYALFDLGNHFCEYAGVDDADYSLCPSTAEKHAFLYDYLKMVVGHVDGDRLDEMCKRIPLFEATAHLFWAVWALVQSQNSLIDFDYLDYAITRHQQYKKRLAKYNASQ